MPNEPCYRVDYIYQGDKVESHHILDIASMDFLWGKDMPEALVAIEDLRVTADMVTLMSADKNPTLKIQLPNNISIIKFKSSNDEYALFSTEGYIDVNIVGKCNSNEWMDNITPQILIEDYEIINSCSYYF